MSNLGAAGMESGTVIVRARPEAASDQLFGALTESVRMMTMHRDAITRLPPKAVWLADSDPYDHQAFRVGEMAWGVQFHPETSPQTYLRWAEFSTDTGVARQKVFDGIPDVESFAEEINSDAHAFVIAFADILQGHVSVAPADGSVEVSASDAFGHGGSTHPRRAK